MLKVSLRVQGAAELETPEMLDPNIFTNFPLDGLVATLTDTIIKDMINKESKKDLKLKLVFKLYNNNLENSTKLLLKNYQRMDNTIL